MQARAQPAEVVRLAGVTKIYPGPPAVAALFTVELKIPTGQYVALMGPSGSGKSTLINLMGLLDMPSGGTVFLEGMDTSMLSDRERTSLRGRRVGFVFQRPHLVSWRTALDNVILGLSYAGVPRAARRPRAAAALARVGLANRSDALPAQMSGGEAQRVATARALAARPALTICDEPTGNLDRASSSRILGLLDELHAEGNTIVVVTHDPEVASRAERTLVLRGGRLADGSSR